MMAKFYQLIDLLKLLSRKSIREPGTPSTTATATFGNNMSTMAGSTTSASSGTARRPADVNPTGGYGTIDRSGATTNDMNTSGSSTTPGEIKPRSLRFTWSMKTTSSMDPADMIREIQKVR